MSKKKLILFVSVCLLSVMSCDSAQTKISTPEKDIEELVDRYMKGEKNVEKLWKKKIQLYKKQRSPMEAKQFEVSSGLILDALINQ